MAIYVDADACPVKQEVCKVATRFGVDVTFVANSHMGLPGLGSPRLVVVRGHLDAADDWIADQASAGDIVVTADIPLAARCIEAGARVLKPNGRSLDEESIGDALATRDLLTDLRSFGETTGGPPPFRPKDRSRFLQALDELLRDQRTKRSV